MAPRGARSEDPLGPGRPWDHPTTGPLLRAALLPDRTAVEAWEGLAPDLDLDRLDPGTQALLPLVWSNLGRLGHPDPGAALLRGTYRYHAAVGQALLHGLGRPLGALAAEGIDALLLGDASLAARHYGDVGLCPIRMIEILVRPADAPRASRVLAHLGWRPPCVVSPRLVATRRALFLGDDGGRHCQLAWHVFEESPGPGDDDLWAAAETLDLHGTPVRLLAPADHLLQVLVDAGRPQRRRGARWVADAVVIARGGEVDWDRLVAQAARRRLVLHARDALAILADGLPGSVPAKTLARLAALPVTRLERAERRLRLGRPSWLGGLPRHWCAYRRRPGAASVPLLGFARYLRDAWGLESLGQVPGALLARAGRHWRAARPGRPGP